MARILVIDDDESVRTTVEAMLRFGGHDVALAVDGLHGLEQFEGRHFDLVLCDVFMPNKEGLETVRELRQLAPTVPIVSMTGSIAPDAGGQPDPDFLRMATELGATAVITKPFRLQDLLALVDQCLGARGLSDRRD
jgi:CheY-like chemotaxis protein